MVKNRGNYRVGDNTRWEVNKQFNNVQGQYTFIISLFHQDAFITDIM